jgi:hypothetical protein
MLRSAQDVSLIWLSILGRPKTTAGYGRSPALPSIRDGERPSGHASPSLPGRRGIPGKAPGAFLVASPGHYRQVPRRVPEPYPVLPIGQARYPRTVKLDYPGRLAILRLENGT